MRGIKRVYIVGGPPFNVEKNIFGSIVEPPLSLYMALKNSGKVFGP